MTSLSCNGVRSFHCLRERRRYRIPKGAIHAERMDQHDRRRIAHAPAQLIRELGAVADLQF